MQPSSVQLKIEQSDQYPPAQHSPEMLVHLLGLAQRFGRSTHSFLSLYPGLSIFQEPEIEGYIPYVTSGNLILIAGEPVCSDSDFAALMSRFMENRSGPGQTIGMIPVSQSTRVRLAELGFDSLYIGKEPIFDLQALPQSSRSIRQAIRRAKRKGLQVIPFAERYRGQIERVSQQWLVSREMPAMSFLFQLRPLVLQEYKKYFLLVDDQGELLAFLACSPIYARDGWYLEDLIRTGDMPNGGTELLIHSAMEALAAEGFQLATLALAPLAGLPDHDEEHPYLNQLLRLSYEHLSFLYHFQTLEFFKGKFQPSVWESNYFCFYPRGLSFKLVQSLLSAFMPSDLPAMLLHKLRQLRRLFATGEEF